MTYVLPGKLADVYKSVDAAKVYKRTKVDNRGYGTFKAHAFSQFLKDLGALVLAAFLKHNAAGEHDVVAVAIHLDNACLNLLVHKRIKILHTAKINQRRRQKAAKTDVEDETTLNDLDNFTNNIFAGVEFLFDVDPSTLVLSAFLGQDQPAVFVLFLQHQCFDLIAYAYDLGRINIFSYG